MVFGGRWHNELFKASGIVSVEVSAAHRNSGSGFRV